MKQTISLRIEKDLLERVRNAIWGTGNRTTITAIAEEALLAWVEGVEAEKNGGRPFPPREGELPYSPKK